MSISMLPLKYNRNKGLSYGRETYGFTQDFSKRPILCEAGWSSISMDRGYGLDSTGKAEMGRCALLFEDQKETGGSLFSKW
jgi:hypothetical protein